MAAARGSNSKSSFSRPSAPQRPDCTERLPSEILLKVLSYLDAASLFCIGHVNKRFHQLANDQSIWQKMYFSEIGKRKGWKPKGVAGVAGVAGVPAKPQDRSARYWKRLYFKMRVGYDVDKWKKELQAINPYTGLPIQTECVLRHVQVSWELTISEQLGRERTFDGPRLRFFDSSVVACWSRGSWPDYYAISTIQLHSVKKVALHCPSLQRPGWRSLMRNFDMETLVEGAQIIGKDRLVKLVLLQPGFIIGIWRGQHSVAFVTACFHFHKLVEKSLLGSSISYSEPVHRAPFDDVDPEYGLHGYTLHIMLHDTLNEIMSGHFPQLFCRRVMSLTDQIRDGLVKLVAISRTNSSQHMPLSGDISLPWKCEAMEGAVENCCLLSVTLLDEFQHPFWCVSSPVTVVHAGGPVSYDYDGERFRIGHRDSEGQVNMELVWMKEQKHFFLVKLTVHVAVGKVNTYFRTDY